VSDAAAAIVELVASDLAGLYHLGGPRRISRFELGALIAARHGYAASALVPALAAEAPTPPRRPRDVSLVSDRVRQHLTTRLRAPEDAH
jgi:dTDP-4-dehydrorhamnose reductase